MSSPFLRTCSAILVLGLALVVARPWAVRDRKLVFDQDGRFKIAQFADLHYGEAENTLWGPQQDVNSTRVMKRVLSWERPDMVVYSGGALTVSVQPWRLFLLFSTSQTVVTGENIDSNATAYWARLLQPCLATSTPWATVFGNHDDRSVSHGTRWDLLQFDTSFSLSLSQFGPADVHGLTNYYLLLYDNQQAQTPSWIIYFLDSGGGTYPELVYSDQIQWFLNTSASLTHSYGPLPALAFFHIPSTGYEGVYQKSVCFGMNDDRVTPQIKANELLAKMAASGVRWVFVGHDHGNDWCCPSPAGLMICYGRHTGYGGYGRWPRGSRIIVLKQTSSLVETYVRMENGSIIDGNIPNMTVLINV